MITAHKRFDGIFKVLLSLSIIILISVCISVIFPVFFRTDDAINLNFLAHRSLFEIFDPSVSLPGGAYRPVAFAFFHISYNIFGLEPFGYQAASTTIFILNFYLLYYFCAVYFDKRSGIIALTMYFILFYNHLQGAFWFSSIVFSMHLMFAFLSIIFYLKSKDELYYLILSCICAALGALTKEPSIIIIIGFIIGHLLISTPYKQYLSKSWILLPYAAIAIIIFLISPVVGNRFKQSVDAANFLYNLGYRYSFYFNFLLSGSKLLIPFILAAILAISVNRSLWIKILLLLTAVPSYFNIYYYIVFLFFVSGIIVLRDKELLPIFIWMLVTSLTLPLMQFITPSYLYEFSFAFAIFLGRSISKQLIEKLPLEEYNINILSPKLIIIISVVLISLAIKPALNQIRALNLVVEARANTKNGIYFIEKNRDKIKYIVVPDQEDGQNYKDIVDYSIRSNAAKAISSKTMPWRSLKAYISLLGLNEIQVLPYSEYIAHYSAGPGIVIFLQNDADIEFATDKKIIGEKLFSYSHYKTNNILISTLR